MCFRELKELYVTFYTMVKLEGKKCFHESSFFSTVHSFFILSIKKIQYHLCKIAK